MAPTYAQTSGLILNEVLANEPGSNTSAEWVEILNWPDEDSSVICLDGFRLIDGADTSRYDTSYCLQPGGFLVIARDTATFEAVWGNNSGAWGDDPSEDYPLIGGNISLRNSSDTLVLVSPFGDTSAIWWTSAQGDTTSLERIRPNGGDAPSNFAESVDPSRATPGRQNSVFPVVGDVALDSVVILQAPLIYGVQGGLRIHFTNVGFGDVDHPYVTVYDDRNLSSPGTVLDPIVIQGYPRLLREGQSDFVEYYPYGPGRDFEDLPPGLHRLVLQLRNDGSLANNEIVLAEAVQYAEPLIVISEFLANPEVGGPEEWVEITNTSQVLLSLRSLRIGDSTQSSAIPVFFNEYISPGQQWVLAENEAAFLSHYPSFSGTLIEVPGWASLNNTGDRATFIGAGGEIIDSVSFRETHEDNRSWERLHVDVSHAMIDQWTASVDPTGATPGRLNSVNAENAGRFAVSIDPNPIYLSAEQEMSISYRLEIGERLTLKIFDRAGRLVRALADDIPAATGTTMWDGTDDKGEHVRPGPYVLLGKSEPAGATCKEVIVVGP